MVFVSTQAFGVPADLMFQGRFASKSTAQLSLLNTTVAQMAKSVNSVLTMAYRDIYGEDDDTDDPAQLQLLTAPLAATEEVIAIFNAGLAPCEIAMPAVLHAIGATKDEIDSAVEKMCKKEEAQESLAAEDRDYQKQDQALSLQERKGQMSSAPDKQKAEADQAKANVSLTKAQAEKTTEEAKQAGKPAPAGPSSVAGAPPGGGSSGSKSGAKPSGKK